MTRTFYIATSLANREQARKLSGLLGGYGMEPTFPWWSAPTFDAAVQAGEDPATWLRDRGHADAYGVMSADVVIVLLPGGHGTHVELGIALATGRTVWLVGSHDGDYPCVFHNIVPPPHRMHEVSMHDLARRVVAPFRWPRL